MLYLFSLSLCYYIQINTKLLVIVFFFDHIYCFKTWTQTHCVVCSGQKPIYCLFNFFYCHWVWWPRWNPLTFDIKRYKLFSCITVIRFTTLFLFQPPKRASTYCPFLSWLVVLFCRLNPPLHYSLAYLFMTVTIYRVRNVEFQPLA